MDFFIKHAKMLKSFTYQLAEDDEVLDVAKGRLVAQNNLKAGSAVDDAVLDIAQNMLIAGSSDEDAMCSFTRVFIRL